MEFKKPKRYVNKVFLHCSASDNSKHDDRSVMNLWHQQRGWSEIGYHYFIKKDGTIQLGRSIEKTPAAQSGHNVGSIAICCHGLLKEKFTQAQFDSLIKLCNNIRQAYSGKVTFHGHCEVSAKACPVFDYKKVLKLDSKGNMK